MAGLGSGVEAASQASTGVGARGRLSTGPWGVERGSLRGTRRHRIGGAWHNGTPAVLGQGMGSDRGLTLLLDGVKCMFFLWK